MTYETSRIKATSAVMELPDPDEMSSCFHLEQGGTLEVRSNAPNYTDFHVEFAGSNPLSDGPLKGSTTCPVVIPIPIDSDGEYEFTVHHIHNHDCNKDRWHRLRLYVHPCKNCPGGGTGI